MSEETNVSIASPYEFAQAVKDNMKPNIMSLSRGTEAGASVLVAPVGMNVHSVKKYLDENRVKPERRKGQAKLDRLQSLIDHINRFKSEASAVFARASITENSIKAHIKAIFDYHPQGGDIKQADNMGHTARYEFPIAKDFEFWLRQNAKLMGQEEFALFLEERVIEMKSPSDADKARIEGLKPKFAEPLEILELSRDLEIYSKETVKQSGKLSSGEREIKFSTEHCDADGKPIQIPDFFVISVPFFEGGNPQRVLVRLRYRKNGDRVNWAYELYRVDEALEEAFDEACKEVTAAVELPMFFGESEGTERD